MYVLRNRLNYIHAHIYMNIDVVVRIGYIYVGITMYNIIVGILTI